MKKSGKNLTGILIISLIMVVVFGLIYFYDFSDLPQDKNSPTENTDISDKVGDIQNKQIQGESTDFIIEVNYPKIGINYIDEEIQSFAENNVQSFKDLISSNQSTIDNKYSLNIEYLSQKYSNRLLSFKFMISEYTGGVHSNFTDATFVFDLVDNKKLSLEDLFVENVDYLKKISNIAITQFKIANISDENWLNEGAGQKLENYKNFIVSDNSIIFYFPPYQVASYAAGEQIVEIPFSQIRNILNPEIFSYDNQVVVEEGISLDSLKSGDKISSPVKITGKINGNGWIGFEGQVGRVELLNPQGNPLAVSSLSAITDWTQLPVRFSATLTFIVPQGVTSGNLVFYNENPSGSSNNDLQFILPIIFK
ncbi:MAG: DUF3298 domain-containing protein [Candidatus Paceibacterota bacterium]|jgi:hypothetical protein